MKSTGDSIANISGNGHRDINIKVNHIACSSVHINKKEEESVKDKSLNWLSVANCFSGRQDIFDEIKKEFTDKKCVVLHGIPGIGKTETARTFGTHNCGDFNGNLIWIFSETSDNIKQCFHNLATSLDLKITDVSQIFNKFVNSKALIVFDNAESMAAIKHYLPSKELHPTVHVLITSRLSTWGTSTSISKIQLNSLKPKDALNIFEQKLGRKFEEYKPEKWEELVRKLDGIPLCLQIVSSLIQQEIHRKLLTEFKLEDFINKLEEKLILSTIPDSEQDYYQKSVLVAINSVLSRLEEAKAISSLDLLCFVAYLDADHIIDFVLLLIPSIEKSKEQLEEALNKVVDYSLIQIVKDSYSSFMKIKVHRTVQLVLRNYDLTKRNGDMFKTLLRLALSHKIYLHESSIFNYANKKEFLEKTKEFYNENHENESLMQENVEYLMGYNCDEVLQIILPKLMNGRFDKFIEMLFFVIDFGGDLKTFQAFLIIMAQNDDVRQFKILSEWQSTKLIDILLKSNIFKYNINLKNNVTGKYLHLLVKKSNKQNIKETIECMNHLVSNWGADILYRDDDLNNILHIACYNSEISSEIIECLFQLENGKLKGIVDCQNDDKETPLHCLLYRYYNYPDILQILRYFICKCKADITIQDENKMNILFDFWANGSFEMIELILKERDCSEVIFVQDEDGDVAFSQLFSNDSIEKTDIIKLIDYILKNKKVLNNSEKRNEIIKKMLYQVIFVQNNNLKIIKHLIENSSICEKTWPSIELIDTLLQANFIENKISAANKFLHLLVYESNKENIKDTIKCINNLLLKWDADILYKNDYLNNILHVACYNKEISLEILEYLFQLENGKLKGIVDCQNEDAETPLHVLLDWANNNSKQFEIFHYFITKFKADITIQNMYGRNILFDLCANGSFEMIELIFKERDCCQIINNQNVWGDVAFSFLIRNESIKEADKLKLFNLFLEYKMDINLKNKQNKTLLEIATEKGLNTLTEVIKKCLKELESKPIKRIQRWFCIKR